MASSSLNIGFTKADQLHAVIQREVLCILNVDNYYLVYYINAFLGSVGSFIISELIDEFLHHCICPSKLQYSSIIN